MFQPGIDFGLAHDADEMVGWLRVLLDHPEMARWMARHGQRTVERRHTCSHRVDELLQLSARLPELQPGPGLAPNYASLPTAV